MSFQYYGDHSIILIDYDESRSGNKAIAKHTWSDFHLIPAKRPSIVYKNPSYYLVDIPGTNRTIDITDYMFGGQTYGMRSGQWQFILDHTQWENWSKANREIEKFINGKCLYCILEDECEKIYKGRFRISGWQNGDSFSAVAIEYNLFDEDMSYELQSKIVSLSSRQQTIVPDTGYYGLSEVIIEPIPENYVDTTGDDGISADVISGAKVLTNVNGVATEIVGTMPNVGTFNGTIDCLTNESCSIPQGFITGGTVTVDTADLEDELASI